MMNDNEKRLDFKEKIIPDLEVLLQFSLWLTKNGRDASGLMREALGEAYRTWEDWTPEESRKVWMHKILTKRFFNGFQQKSRLQLHVADNVDDRLIMNNRIFPETSISSRQPSFLTGESNEDIDYFKAIASLPAVFRSAMILSCLEGFSNREIAELAGVDSQNVESLLNRGRKFLREELFAHLMGKENFEKDSEQEAATG